MTTMVQRTRLNIGWKINRAAIGVNSLWMTMLIALREIPQRAARLTYRAQRNTTPRRVLALAVLGAVLVAPSVLYLTEHSAVIAERRAHRGLALEAAAETAFLRSALSETLAQQARLTGALLNSGYRIHTGEHVTVKVVATGYSSTVFETDNSPFTTASNTHTREGIVALSRDLLKRYTEGAPFDFGDRVHVANLGDFIVEDSMNPRWTNRADIWFPSREEALQFGVRDVLLNTMYEEPSVSDPGRVSEAEHVTTAAAGL